MEAELALYLLTLGCLDYDSHEKHPLNGVGLTPIPDTKGGKDVVCAPTDNSYSPLSSVNAVDVKLSATYLVLIMYL